MHAHILLSLDENSANVDISIVIRQIHFGLVREIIACLLTVDQKRVRVILLLLVC